MLVNSTRAPCCRKDTARCLDHSDTIVRYTVVPRHIHTSAADSLRLSSFKIFQVGSKRCVFCALECLMAFQGHPSFRYHSVPAKFDVFFQEKLFADVTAVS